MSVTTARPKKGVSLARVPALALGTFLVVAGLYFVYMEHGFPRLSQFPDGTAHVDGKAFFGVFALNGWSGELTVAAGALLMLGAAQHALAKAASFIVAVVFAGVGVWALVNHHSALGLFAAGTWTVLLWFAAAVYLIVNMMLPRVGGERVTEPAPVDVPRRSAAAPAPAPAEPVTAVTPAEPVTTAAPAEPVTAVTPAEPVTAAAPSEPVTAAAPAEPVTTVTPSEPVADPTATEPVAAPATEAASAPVATEAGSPGTTASSTTAGSSRSGSSTNVSVDAQPTTGDDDQVVPARPDSLLRPRTRI